MSEWRPIESAPKDGTWVLLWLADDGWRPRRAVCHWDEHYDFDQYGEPCGAWVGLFSVAGMRSIKEIYSSQPTHWMPLPAPPADPKEEV